MTYLTEYVGFWQRTLAFWVDMLWLVPLLMGISYIVCGASDCTAMPQNFDTLSQLEQIPWQTILINDILPALLILWFWIAHSATPGKMLVDCKIVDAKTGKPITFKQAFLRCLGYIISFLSLGLGFLWILWDDRRQGWHDKIANTVVILHDEATVPLFQLEKYYR
ncbi:membrane protein [Beggiatoa sp. PS]|nr:membrane protein [Beggiatoa sp. PS]